MVKCENCRTELRGDLTEISADVVMILKSYREMLTEQLGEQIADVFFAEMGRTACTDEQELFTEKHLEEAKARVLGALGEE